MDVDVDSLPDDVIAKIFSLLPPLMLVDSIPLVCKRWHQLARHPDSWRYFNLTIPAHGAEKQKMIEVSRFVKVAPYLNCIDFSKILELTPPVTSLVNLLLEDHKTIKSIRTFETSTKRMRAFSKKMLKRFSGSLREVHITFVSPDIVTEEFHASVNNLLTLVSEMPQLSTLGFNVLNVEQDLKNYSGQLGKGCPSLKKFVLQGIFEGEWIRFIFDVLESKKDQLQEIDVQFLCEPDFLRYVDAFRNVFDVEETLTLSTERFVDAVRNCHNVETLRIPIGMLSVTSHMSQLQSLGLCFNREFEFMNTESVPIYVEDSPVKGKIKELSLCCLDSEATSSHCLEAIAERSKDIRVFSISNVTKQSVLNLFLSNMKLLHTLKIHDCWGGNVEDIFSKIRNLSYLKYLKITKLKFRVKSEQEKFDNTVQLFKEMQPGLVVEYESKIVDGSYSDSDLSSNSYYDYDGYDYDGYDYDEHEFTYFDYLRNKYGEDLSDSELYAFMSSDED